MQEARTERATLMPSMWQCPKCEKFYPSSWGRCVKCGTFDQGNETSDCPRIKQDLLLEALFREHGKKE
jgi:predicted ATP-dependent serine protease